MQAREKKKNVFERTMDRFELPGEVLADLPRVTITGGSRLLLENHKGIMDYGAELILVAGGKVTVKILGQALEMRAMTTEALLITGDIFQVEFLY